MMNKAPAPSPRFLWTLALLVALLIPGSPTGGCSSPLPEAQRIIDLTHSFDASTVYWPTEPLFRHEVYTAGITPRGYWYASARFAAAEHGGTHVDAPYHFARDGETVDDIPLDRLVGPGVLIDITEACDRDPDYLVTIEDLTRWETRHGRLPDGAIVLLRTGFGVHYDDPESYLGTSRRGPEAVPELHFPGLDPDAARWLATERSIGAIGLDTASIDHGPSVDFASHVALFEHGIPALENVANLELLPEAGFEVIALPMKIRGGTGAPLRVIALLR